MIDRIVVINDLSHPMGGASLLAVRSAGEFARRGLPVTFLCGDTPPPQGGAVDHVGLGQERLLAGGAARNALRGIYNSAAAAMVRDWIARNDTRGTIYHLHGWSQILSPAIFAALSGVADRLLLTAHDFFIACPNGAAFDYREGKPCSRKPMGPACIAARCDRRHYAHKLWRVARHGVQNVLLERGGSPDLLLIHDAMRPYLRDCPIPPARQVTLPNPVTPFTATRVEAERNSAVLFVGRMEHTKGIDLAARACREAGVHLIALGDGALIGELRRHYPEFEFPGRIASERIGEYAARARLLVMPSLHMEPFGLTAVEALWSGLPVVLSPHSLIAADIVAAGAGEVVDPTDTAAFAQVLRRLADDDAQLRRASLAAMANTRSLAMEIDAWIDALLAGYRAKLAGQPLARACRGQSGDRQMAGNGMEKLETVTCESV